jgi:hypothetical protein
MSLDRQQPQTSPQTGEIAGLRERHGVVTAPAVWPGIIDRNTHERLRAILTDVRPPEVQRHRRPPLAAQRLPGLRPLAALPVGERALREAWATRG